MNEEHEIQNALTPPPVEREPSADLTRRLRVMARETPARRPSFWRSGKALPFAVVGGAALVAAVSLMPAKASAKTFDMVVAAAQGIDAFQFSIVSDEGAKEERFTVAGANGHVYLHGGEGAAMDITDDAISLYDRKENKVTRMRFGGLMDAQTAAGVSQAMRSGITEGLKEMDLKKLLEEYRKKYGPGGVRVSPQSREDGRWVYHVTLSQPNQPERVEITVDDKTDLPDRLDVTRDGKSVMRMEMRFGDRVDAKLLRSPIPAGAKVEEIDLGAMAGDAMKGIGEGLKKMGEGMKKGP